MLDSFMGCSSTAIACLETGIELDPVLFAASVERLENWLATHKTKAAKRRAIA